MKQDNNELKVIIKVKELAVHTIKLTSNCNKFPKKYRFTLCDRMQNKSMNIYELLLEANRTHLNNLPLRNDLQTKVILNCDELLFYIEMCLQLQIIQPNSAEYWSKLVSDIKFMTIKWRTKDKER
ncbi:MAG: four helix bundle protein [Clostridia bacterium]|nr:four helix bundle protein [Clostridia bacterium]